MAGFKPGQSGNPKGKPIGAKSKFTKLREQLSEDLPELLAVTKRLALEGDTTALRLLLERTLPPQKATASLVMIAGLDEARTLSEKARLILNAVGGGELPPDIGATMLTALGAVARIVEVDELERRISDLEQKQ